MMKIVFAILAFIFTAVNTNAQKRERPVSSVTQNSGTNCVSCAITNPTFSYDNDDLTLAKYSIVLGAQGAFIGQTLTFSSDGCPGDTVYFKVMNLSNVVDSNLNNIEYFSLLGGVSNGDNKKVTKAGIQTSVGGNFSIIKFVPKKNYNAVALRFKVGGASALNEFNVYDVSRWTDQPFLSLGSMSVCYGDSMLISVSNFRNENTNNKIIYTWYASPTGGNSIRSGNENIKTGPLFKDTTYYLENCLGSKRMPLTIKVLKRPIRPKIDGNLLICRGSSTTLTADQSDPGAIFKWVNRENGDSTFGNSYNTKSLDKDTKILVYTILGVCSIDTPDTIDIVVKIPLEAPKIKCGVPTINSVSFEWDDVPGAEGYFYSEDGGKTFVNNLTRTDHTIPNLKFGDTRTLIVYAKGPAPCGNSPLSLAITCIATNCEAVTFDDPQVFSACKGNYVELHVDNINTPDYEVSFAGGPFLPTNKLNYLVQGDANLAVEVRNSKQPGCPGVKKTINVIGKDNPEPKFSSDRLIVTVPNGAVQFYDQTEGAVERLWDFGDGTTSTEQYPVHKYQNTGKYTVSLQVKNKDGCVSSSQILEYIEGKFAPEIIIPNAFSPNGDNQNDKFEVRTTRILDKDYYLTIFSPNGQKLFETFNKSEYWDGKFGTIDMPVGPYFYTLNAVSDDNQKFEKKGLINIIR